VLLGGRLAQDNFENLFPSYVSGDEQSMRRAKWSPAGSSILAWMRDRDSALLICGPGLAVSGAGYRNAVPARSASVRPSSSQLSSSCIWL
jgi:hypothetical protein